MMAEELNLLFVEALVGFAWSYSNTISYYTCGDEYVMNLQILVFLSRWFKRFPKYASKDLFLTNESYAWHYIPQLVNKLLNYNKVAKIYKFNLKGISIGNSLLSLNVDTTISYEFLWPHGLISDEFDIAILKICKFDKRIKNVDVIDISKECDDILWQVASCDDWDVTLHVIMGSVTMHQVLIRGGAKRGGACKRIHETDSPPFSNLPLSMYCPDMMATASWKPSYSPARRLSSGWPCSQLAHASSHPSWNSLGLAFLHTNTHLTIIRGDMKPNNVQFDVDFEAHLLDFGLDRLEKIPVDLYSSTPMPVGSLGHVSLEIN
jgi:hypothetical protein